MKSNCEVAHQTWIWRDSERKCYEIYYESQVSGTKYWEADGTRNQEKVYKRYSSLGK